MKKFVVLLVVVALTCFSAAAFAADITVSGQIDIRSRDFTDLSLQKVEAHNFSFDAAGTPRAGTISANKGNTRDTQERVRLTVDAKTADVKGRIQIENDWDTWGRLDGTGTSAAYMGNGKTTSPDSGSVGLKLREAWINFNVPGIPVNVNVGHQLLQLGNGWFLRSMKYGDDAWVLANVTGPNTVAFADIKVSEGTPDSSDIDAYAILDVYKLSDTMTVGIDIADVVDRRDGALPSADPAKTASLQNLGVNFNGAFGPMNLKAEIDYQMGKSKSALATGGKDTKYKGNQVVVQGNAGFDPVTVNFTLARGSGTKRTYGPADDETPDFNGFINFMDADQHYTFLYEYKIGQPSWACTGGVCGFGQGNKHFGFSNTTALNVGASVNATKGLNVGVDFWYLQATEKLFNGTFDSSTGDRNTSNKLGYEVDAHVNWQMYDNLSWNWQVGYFKPGEAYKATGADDLGNDVDLYKDAATGIQGVLSFKF